MTTAMIKTLALIVYLLVLLIHDDVDVDQQHHQVCDEAEGFDHGRQSGYERAAMIETLCRVSAP